ncbi:hypothetical protein BBK14_33360 [Parafrankia soli]|uniref:Uncharacterized protein n=1 Tax=Parafrankia soli TaxID=2599596 RepID=A0A1S1QN40_9ACTN|nr:hypothetical protein [Parafrankia soli]OHV36148.1 hypothetical protein BBK14_33360 [Parafrankia soli]
MRIHGLFGDAGDAPDDEVLDDEPYLPVLHDLSADGYCGFQGALGQARHLATMHQRDADDPGLPAVARAQAAAVATNVAATTQLFAALIGDRTDLDALYAADDDLS